MVLVKTKQFQVSCLISCKVWALTEVCALRIICNVLNEVQSIDESDSRIMAQLDLPQEYESLNHLYYMFQSIDKFDSRIMAELELSQEYESFVLCLDYTCLYMC